MSLWMELSENCSPTRGRWTTTDRNRGEKKYNKIINNTPIIAKRTLGAGMHSGMSSPERPWIRLTVSDPDLAEYGPVKVWLSIHTKRMLDIFAKSNLYDVLPTTYEDCGVFGVSAFSLMPDKYDVMRAYSFPIGSYMIGNDDRLVQSVFAREFMMTVRQIVERFGVRNAKSESEQFANISRSVKSLWDKGQYEQWIDVVHVIQPNSEFDPRLMQSRYKPWSSIYYEVSTESGKLLEESGHDENPIICPRWGTTGEDVYGTESPGIEALGDMKELQYTQKQKSMAVAKMVNPAMIGPLSLRGSKVTLLPGDITFVESTHAAQGFRPAHDVNFRVDVALQDIASIEARINSAFYKDLFLMLATSDRREMTAREVVERHEEKMVILGPVTGRLNRELHRPLVDRAFGIMLRRGLVSPPPPELSGMPLKVEFISIMSQAQKAINKTNIEQFSGYVGSMMEAIPSIVDKLDADQSVDEYAEAINLPPSVVRSDEMVAEIRQQRMAQQQQEQQLMRLEQVAQGAKLMSETDTSRQSLLTQLTQG